MTATPRKTLRIDLMFAPLVYRHRVDQLGRTANAENRLSCLEAVGGRSGPRVPARLAAAGIARTAYGFQSPSGFDDVWMMKIVAPVMRVA
jgi:hypothetical protein